MCVCVCVRGSTLNVSIKAGGCAWWRGREPEPALHVYLGVSSVPPSPPRKKKKNSGKFQSGHQNKEKHENVDPEEKEYPS